MIKPITHTQLVFFFFNIYHNFFPNIFQFQFKDVMFIEKKAEILTVCNIGQVKRKNVYNKAYYIFINIFLRPKVSYAIATGRNLISSKIIARTNFHYIAIFSWKEE